MNARPTSVTIIAWILIALGVFGLVSVPLNMGNPMARELLSASPLSYEMHMTISAISSLVSIVCGYFILKGRDWARVLYIAVNAVGILVALLTSPMKSPVLISVVLLGVIAFFLFRGPANAFFGKSYFGGGNAPRA